MEVKQGTRERMIVQVSLKSISQQVKFGDGMIVTNGLSRGFPDMLLRIEFGRGWRQPKDLKPRVVVQERLNKLAAMPRGTIPQEQDGLRRIGRQEHEQKEDSGRPIHRRGTQAGLFPGLQVERTIEMGGITVG
jgi:hypothetical protein